MAIIEGHYSYPFHVPEMTLFEMLRQRSPSVGRVKSAYITRAGS